MDFGGLLVEEGANWITGTSAKKTKRNKQPKTNPIWKLAQNVKLETEVPKTPAEPAFDAEDNGKNISKKFDK